MQAGAGDRNNFYWFFRNDGRSGKRAEDAGSWGVGKTVFQELSQVNANFALTVRYDDQQRLLMGKTLLKTHQETRNGHLKRYAAYGYWAGPREPDEPYMPIEDTGVLDRFVSDFEVTRKSESGLSIIVPFPHESVTGDALIRGVLVSYFRPIVTQKLVVVVDDNGNERRLADADDLRRAVETIEMEGAEREQLTPTPRHGRGSRNVAGLGHVQALRPPDLRIDDSPRGGHPNAGAIRFRSRPTIARPRTPGGEEA